MRAISIATRRGTPARSTFLTAERRRPWKCSPGRSAASHALLQPLRWAPIGFSVQLKTHGRSGHFSLRLSSWNTNLEHEPGTRTWNTNHSFISPKMPRDAVIDRNKPPIIEDFAVQRADGTDLAMRFNQMVAVRGAMPNGGTNQIEIAVCSIPALLAMKGYAVHNRLKQKDAYDIYYCIHNYPEGIDALAKDCLPLLNLPSGATGYGFISEKFDVVDGFGPTCVRNFVQESNILGDRTPDQWQQHAFGQVDAWLRALGLRV